MRALPRPSWDSSWGMQTLSESLNQYTSDCEGGDCKENKWWFVHETEDRGTGLLVERTEGLISAAAWRMSQHTGPRPGGSAARQRKQQIQRPWGRKAQRKGRWRESQGGQCGWSTMEGKDRGSVAGNLDYLLNGLQR